MITPPSLTPRITDFKTVEEVELEKLRDLTIEAIPPRFSIISDELRKIPTHPIEQCLTLIFKELAHHPDLVGLIFTRAFQDKAPPLTIRYLLKYYHENFPSSLPNLKGGEIFIYYALFHRASVEVLREFQKAGCRFDIALEGFENDGNHIASALSLDATEEVIHFLLSMGAKVDEKAITTALEYRAAGNILTLVLNHFKLIWVENRHLL